MAPTDLRTEFGRTPDELFVPVIVEQQLVADRRIELGVWFDTFVRLSFIHSILPSLHCS